MRIVRKFILLFFILFFTLLLSTSSNCSSEIIHETREYETVSKGVTLEKITRFTSDGWLRINVLRIFIETPYLELDLLSNPDGLRLPASTEDLAESYDAIAAVNGSFFSWAGQAGQVYPEGLIIQSGEITSASTEFNKYNDVMATFSFDYSQNSFFDFWKTDIRLLSSYNFSLNIDTFNKSNYINYAVYDKNWGEKTLDSQEPRFGIYEMIIEDGKVSEIRHNMPPATIPEDGYVVVSNEIGGQYLVENFEEGSVAIITMATLPNWQNIKMAVSGSSVLVNEGVIIRDYAYDITGRHPRTAIGSSITGKQIFLVTVDGRQQGSIGMTQKELAYLMRTLGAHYAINLDGGGSTTMLSRTEGGDSLKLQNNPSSGYQRSVANAVGVFSKAPVLEPERIIIKTKDTNVFKDTSREFLVMAVDSNSNPVNIDTSQVEWSVEGVEGDFLENVFYPKSSGEAVITATFGDISSSIEVNVLSSPVELTLDENYIHVPVNKKVHISVSGRDINGFTALIDSLDIDWSITDTRQGLHNGVFTAKSAGAGYIVASFNKVIAICSFSVQAEEKYLIDKFEIENGSFTSYPLEGMGSYTISDEQKHSDNFSGKLTYDFPEYDDTKAAYLVFNEEGIEIEEDAVKIGLWLYNEKENSNWLRAQVEDSQGKKHLLTFSKNLDWTGWKYVEAPINNITGPLKLKRIYIVSIFPDSDSGFVYFDDLFFIKNNYIQLSSIEPKNTRANDPNKKNIEYDEQEKSFRFFMLGSFDNTPEDKFNQLLYDKLYEENNINVVSSFEEIDEKYKNPLLENTLYIDEKYSSYEYNNSLFIVLDNDSCNGLRATDKEQWPWLLEQLEIAKQKDYNVFIILENLVDSFTDKGEENLLKNILSEYHIKTQNNVWVFYRSDSNCTHMEGGVKYLGLAPYNKNKVTHGINHNMFYIVTTVYDNEVFFEYKKAFPEITEDLQNEADTEKTSDDI